MALQRAEYSLLSDKIIIQELENGNIVIDPFEKNNLNNNSYDICLGEYFFRERPENGVINIYDEKSIRKMWSKLLRGKKFYEFDENFKKFFQNSGFSNNDKIILIEPGELILAHTNEFIGGVNDVTTILKTKSSLARCGIDICGSAGMGDIGYINRWALQIKNNTKRHTIPLICGQKIGQIIFHKTDGTKESYEKKGNYQNSSDLNDVKVSWSPYDLLPKCKKTTTINNDEIIYHNLTPHDIFIYTEDKDLSKIIERSGYVMRIESLQETLPEKLDNLIIKTPQNFKGFVIEVIDKTEKYEDFLKKFLQVNIIVSDICANYLKNDEEFLNDYKIERILSPNTSPDSVIRNIKGEIIGVKSLIQHYP